MLPSTASGYPKDAPVATSRRRSGSSNLGPIQEDLYERGWAPSKVVSKTVGSEESPVREGGEEDREGTAVRRAGDIVVPPPPPPLQSLAAWTSTGQGLFHTIRPTDANHLTSETRGDRWIGEGNQPVAEPAPGAAHPSDPILQRDRSRPAREGEEAAHTEPSPFPVPHRVEGASSSPAATAGYDLTAAYAGEEETAAAPHTQGSSPSFMDTYPMRQHADPGQLVEMGQELQGRAYTPRGFHTVLHEKMYSSGRGMSGTTSTRHQYQQDREKDEEEDAAAEEGGGSPLKAQGLRSSLGYRNRGSQMMTSNAADHPLALLREAHANAHTLDTRRGTGGGGVVEPGPGTRCDTVKVSPAGAGWSSPNAARVSSPLHSTPPPRRGQSQPPLRATTTTTTTTPPQRDPRHSLTLAAVQRRPAAVHSSRSVSFAPEVVQPALAAPPSAFSPQRTQQRRGSSPSSSSQPSSGGTALTVSSSPSPPYGVLPGPLGGGGGVRSRPSGGACGESGIPPSDKLSLLRSTTSTSRSLPLPTHPPSRAGSFSATMNSSANSMRTSPLQTVGEREVSRGGGPPPPPQPARNGTPDPQKMNSSTQNATTAPHQHHRRKHSSREGSSGSSDETSASSSTHETRTNSSSSSGSSSSSSSGRSSSSSTYSPAQQRKPARRDMKAATTAARSPSEQRSTSDAEKAGGGSHSTALSTVPASTSLQPPAEELSLSAAHSLASSPFPPAAVILRQRDRIHALVAAQREQSLTQQRAEDRIQRLQQQAEVAAQEAHRATAAAQKALYQRRHAEEQLGLERRAAQRQRAAQQRRIEELEKVVASTEAAMAQERAAQEQAAAAAVRTAATEAAAALEAGFMAQISQREDQWTQHSTALQLQLQMVSEELQLLRRDELQLLEDRTALRREVDALQRALQDTRDHYARKVLPEALKEAEERSLAVLHQQEKNLLEREQQLEAQRTQAEAAKLEWQRQVEAEQAALSHATFRVRGLEERVRDQEDTIEKLRADVFAARRGQRRRDEVASSNEATLLQEAEQRAEKMEGELRRAKQQLREQQDRHWERLQTEEVQSRQREAAHQVDLEDVTRRHQRAEAALQQAHRQLHDNTERISKAEELQQQLTLTLHAARREKEALAAELHAKEDVLHRTKQDRESLQREKQVLVQQLKHLQARSAAQEKELKGYRNALWNLQARVWQHGMRTPAALAAPAHGTWASLSATDAEATVLRALLGPSEEEQDDDEEKSSRRAAMAVATGSPDGLLESPQRRQATRRTKKNANVSRHRRHGRSQRRDEDKSRSESDEEEEEEEATDASSSSASDDEEEGRPAHRRRRGSRGDRDGGGANEGTSGAARGGSSSHRYDGGGGGRANHGGQTRSHGRPSDSAHRYDVASEVRRLMSSQPQEDHPGTNTKMKSKKQQTKEKGTAVAALASPSPSPHIAARTASPSFRITKAVFHQLPCETASSTAHDSLPHPQQDHGGQMNGAQGLRMKEDSGREERGSSTDSTWFDDPLLQRLARGDGGAQLFPSRPTSAGAAGETEGRSSRSRGARGPSPKGHHPSDALRTETHTNTAAAPGYLRGGGGGGGAADGPGGCGRHGVAAFVGAGRRPGGAGGGGALQLRPLSIDRRSQSYEPNTGHPAGAERVLQGSTPPHGRPGMEPGETNPSPAGKTETAVEKAAAAAPRGAGVPREEQHQTVDRDGHAPVPAAPAQPSMSGEAFQSFAAATIHSTAAVAGHSLSLSSVTATPPSSVAYSFGQVKPSPASIPAAGVPPVLQHGAWMPSALQSPLQNVLPAESGAAADPASLHAISPEDDSVAAVCGSPAPECDRRRRSEPLRECIASPEDGSGIPGPKASAERSGGGGGFGYSSSALFSTSSLSPVQQVDRNAEGQDPSSILLPLPLPHHHDQQQQQHHPTAHGMDGANEAPLIWHSGERTTATLLQSSAAATAAAAAASRDGAALAAATLSSSAAALHSLSTSLDMAMERYKHKKQRLQIEQQHHHRIRRSPYAEDLPKDEWEKSGEGSRGGGGPSPNSSSSSSSSAAHITLEDLIQQQHLPSTPSPPSSLPQTTANGLTRTADASHNNSFEGKGTIFPCSAPLVSPLTVLTTSNAGGSTYHGHDQPFLHDGGALEPASRSINSTIHPSQSQSRHCAAGQQRGNGNGAATRPPALHLWRSGAPETSSETSGMPQTPFSPTATGAGGGVERSAAIAHGGVRHHREGKTQEHKDHKDRKKNTRKKLWDASQRAGGDGERGQAEDRHNRHTDHGVLDPMYQQPISGGGGDDDPVRRTHLNPPAASAAARRTEADHRRHKEPIPPHLVGRFIPLDSSPSASTTSSASSSGDAEGEGDAAWRRASTVMNDDDDEAEGERVESGEERPSRCPRPPEAVHPTAASSEDLPQEKEHPAHGGEEGDSSFLRPMTEMPSSDHNKRFPHPHEGPPPDRQGQQPHREEEARATPSRPPPPPPGPPQPLLAKALLAGNSPLLQRRLPPTPVSGGRVVAEEELLDQPRHPSPPALQDDADDEETAMTTCQSSSLPPAGIGGAVIVIDGSSSAANSASTPVRIPATIHNETPGGAASGPLCSAATTPHPSGTTVHPAPEETADRMVGEQAAGLVVAAGEGEDDLEDSFDDENQSTSFPHGGRITRTATATSLGTISASPTAAMGATPFLPLAGAGGGGWTADGARPHKETGFGSSLTSASVHHPLTPPAQGAGSSGRHLPPRSSSAGLFSGWTPPGSHHHSTNNNNNTAATAASGLHGPGVVLTYACPGGSTVTEMGGAGGSSGVWLLPPPLRGGDVLGMGNGVGTRGPRRPPDTPPCERDEEEEEEEEEVGSNLEDDSRYEATTTPTDGDDDEEAVDILERLERSPPPVLMGTTRGEDDARDPRLDLRQAPHQRRRREEEEVVEVEDKEEVEGLSRHCPAGIRDGGAARLAALQKMKKTSSSPLIAPASLSLSSPIATHILGERRLDCVRGERDGKRTGGDIPKEQEERGNTGMHTDGFIHSKWVSFCHALDWAEFFMSLYSHSHATTFYAKLNSWDTRLRWLGGSNVLFFSFLSLHHVPLPLLLPPTLPTLSLCSSAMADLVINPRVLSAEYAVRGLIPTRADQIKQELKEGKGKYSFSDLVYCNIGNPQSLQQKPLTFYRQVMSLIDAPFLLENPAIVSQYPADVIARAKEYLSIIGGATGAYTESSGYPFARQAVADYINNRDNKAEPLAKISDIFLTDGASAGVKLIMNILIGGPTDAAMIPLPQYPLYTAQMALLDGKVAPYYLREAECWGVQAGDLAAAYEESVAKNKSTPRMMVVINPGNPTGAVLERGVMEEIVKFCCDKSMVVVADEVYQENIYVSNKKFVSFRDVVCRMPEPYRSKTMLVSLHSTSKGIIGECGRRGGYFEVLNIPDALRAQIVKMSSINLCPNVNGQIMTALMCSPPKKGDASYDAFTKEYNGIFDSLKKRADMLTTELNKITGFSCQKSEGAMYAFPTIVVPKGFEAHNAELNAKEGRKLAVDARWALELLEESGIVVVPGSGFGQMPNTLHFRTTILPPMQQMERMVKSIKAFQEGLYAKYK
eukprot:gene12221-8410_t